jgi:hypothetical protein
VPVQEIFVLPLAALVFLTSFLLIAQQAGQAVVPGRLSLNMSLLMMHTQFEF